MEEKKIKVRDLRRGLLVVNKTSGQVCTVKDWHVRQLPRDSRDERLSEFVYVSFDRAFRCSVDGVEAVGLDMAAIDVNTDKLHCMIEMLRDSQTIDRIQCVIVSEEKRECCCSAEMHDMTSAI